MTNNIQQDENNVKEKTTYDGDDKENYVTKQNYVKRKNTRPYKTAEVFSSIGRFRQLSW